MGSMKGSLPSPDAIFAAREKALCRPRVTLQMLQNGDVWASLVYQKKTNYNSFASVLRHI